jgi:hypothetical protein
VEPICVRILNLRVTRKNHPPHNAEMSEVEAGLLSGALGMLIQLTECFWHNLSLVVVVQYAICVVLLITKRQSRHVAANNLDIGR